MSADILDIDHHNLYRFRCGKRFLRHLFLLYRPLRREGVLRQLGASLWLQSGAESVHTAELQVNIHRN